MTVSKELVDFIKSHEGLRLRAYQPVIGDRWTIGYGSTFIHNKPVVSTDTITEDEAMTALTEDLNRLEVGLSKPGLPLGLTRQQLEATLSLVYNIGLTAFQNSDTGKLFYRGHDISNRFELYNKSGGRVLAGLTNRRLQERAIYTNGIYA